MDIPRPLRFAGLAVAVAGLVLWAVEPGTDRAVAAALAAALGGAVYLGVAEHGDWAAVLPLFAAGLVAGYALSWLVVGGLPVVLAGAPPSTLLETVFANAVAGLVVAFPATAGLLFTGLASGVT